MKNTLIRALAALVAVMLLLTGCNLIAIDEEMQAAEDAAALEKDYATVLVEFNDGSTITKGDVIDFYNDQYSYYSYLYSLYYNQIPDDLSDYVKNQALDVYTEQALLKMHAADYGVEMTDELRATAAEEAETEWEDTISSYITSNLADVEDEDAAREQAIAGLEELGYTQDYFVEEHENSALINAIYEQMIADVTEVPEERLQEEYEARVAEDEETYAEDVDSYETALQDDTTTLYWNQEGYRMVQHILVKPSDEDLLVEYSTISNEISSLQTELMELVADTNTDPDAEATEAPEAPEATEEPAEVRDMATVRDEINAKNEELKAVEDKILADCSATVEEIQGRLDEGEAFPDLILEYTADTEAVFYVSANTTSLITPFKEAALALENVGDVSDPVVGDYGVHLIYYLGDVTPGAVALEDVREELTAEVLETMQQERYDELVAQWTEDAGTQTYLERWTDD